MDAPEMATAALPAPPRFLDDAARVKTISLSAPVTYNGVDYREIVLRRLTAGAVAAFVKSIEVREGAEGGLTWPIFYGPDGALVPEIVLAALCDDDRLVLDEAALSFLPRRFRAAPVADSPPGSGDSTAP